MIPIYDLPPIGQGLAGTLEYELEREAVRVFERFTDRARRVLVLAQEEARLLNHSFIGTEHILLGLIHEGEGVAATPSPSRTRPSSMCSVPM